MLQYVKCLRGQTMSPTTLTDGDWDEISFEKSFISQRTSFLFYMIKALVLYHHGYYRRALHHIELSTNFLDSVAGKKFVFVLFLKYSRKFLENSQKLNYNKIIIVIVKIIKYNIIYI